MAPIAPSRSEALFAYNRAQRRGTIWGALNLVILCTLPLLIDLETLRRYPAESFIVFGVATFPTLMGFAYAYAQRRKRVEELRDDIIFGKITKSDILAAVREVRTQMGPNTEQIQVYITNERNVNAFAISLGLGSILNRFRAVHINRGTLHALDREELTTIIAHEFAHLVRYPQRYHQLLLLNLFASATVALTIYSHTAEAIVGIAAAGIYFFLFRVFSGNVEREIEYLCDDVGAEIGGIDAALRAEYLVSFHSEALTHGMMVALKRKLTGTPLSAGEINRILEEATPFNPIPRELLQREVEARLELHERKRESSFLAFIQALVFGSSIESRRELEEQVEEYERVLRAPKLPPPDSAHPPLSRPWFERLIQEIRAKPDHVLFLTPEDLSDRNSSHPGPRKRLLYLWQSYCETDRSNTRH